MLCDSSDIQNIEPIKIGLTNKSFKFDCKGKSYVLRIPGVGTDSFLSRQCEAESEAVAASLGLDATVIYIDPATGWKLSEFIEDADYIDPYDAEGDQAVAMQMLKKLHEQKLHGCWDFDFVVCAEKYISDIENDLGLAFPYKDIHAQMRELSALLDKEGFERVLCHNDTWYWNYLKDKDGTIQLIDWEYAGNNYPVCDVADYTLSLQFTDQQYLDLVQLYEGRLLSEKEIRFCYGQLALCCWHWSVWAIYKDATGANVEDREIWFGKANRYLAKTQAMYGIV